MNTFPSYWHAAKQELSNKDKHLKEVIHRYEGEGLTSRGDAFHTLCRSIVGQQISVKAADSVWNKLENASKTHKKGFHPHFFVESDENSLRDCGLSRQKINYLGNISNFFLKNDVKDDYFHELDDGEVIKQLTSIKGIGKWTAEMFLIFHLLRPDVFPVDDIGLIRAIEKLYHNGDVLNKKQVSEYKEKYSPYSTVATWYLWRSLDPVPVAY